MVAESEQQTRGAAPAHPGDHFARLGLKKGQPRYKYPFHLIGRGKT